MKINIVFLKSKNDFTQKDKNRLKEIINRTIKDASRILEIKEEIINFIIYPFVGNFLLTQGGIHSKEWIELIIFPDLNKAPKMENLIKSFVYHEMHHLSRGFVQYHFGEKPTLIEAIFAEGLATAFEEENILDYKSQSSVYEPAFIQRQLPEIKKQKYNVDYDYNQYFSQSGFGYKIGKYFVDLIFNRFPYLNSRMLVRTSVTELLELLDQSGINLK